MLPGALDRRGIGGYLLARGLITADAEVAVERLSGGVSADVVAVRVEDRRGHRDWVVKRTLPQLRVASTWLAAPERAITEGRAMAVAAEVLGARVPALVFLDPVDFVTVQERAPRSLTEWRETLLSGPGDGAVATARALGTALADLHSGTADRPDLVAHFGDLTALVQLRIDPFHRTVAAALPQVAPLLLDLERALLEQQRCLVHGDFTPKNVLAAGAELRVLDWEVAHLGNPVFDVGLLLAHLVCKAVHRPAATDHYVACAREFHRAYAGGVAAALRPDDRSTAAQLAGFVLARTDGKSPAGYLSAGETDTARHLALRWLTDPTVLLADVWGDLARGRSGETETVGATRAASAEQIRTTGGTTPTDQQEATP